MDANSKQKKDGSSMVIVLVLLAMLGLTLTMVNQMGDEAVGVRKIYRNRFNKDHLTTYLKSVVSCPVTISHMDKNCGDQKDKDPTHRYIALYRGDDTLISLKKFNVPRKEGVNPDPMFGLYQLQASCGIGPKQKTISVDGIPDSPKHEMPIDNVIVDCGP